jgi:hypothetical protein
VSEKSQVPIAACVSETEQVALVSTGDLIAGALSEASGVSWECNPAFMPDLDALAASGEATIIVTSFLPELAALDIPWPQHEQRLRTSFASLCQGGRQVYICTILRHVGENDPAGEARLIRLRRLNLLAAEISREFGASVIDLDRALAHVGARRLGTDYRLVGKAAVEMAAHFIAITLIDSAMDPFCSFEIQEAAKTILNGRRSVLGEADSIKPEVTIRKNVMIMGQGRQKQIVAPIAFSVQENYAGWLVGHVLRGALGPKEVLQRFIQALRRRGVRGVAAMLGVGLVRQIQRKK